LVCAECRRQYRFRRGEDGQIHLRLPEPIDRPCPACAKPMEVRSGRYGKFVGCTGFPECKTTEAVP
jgi:DNA topoisomerase-1